jgi:hypothetical protein
MAGSGFSYYATSVADTSDLGRLIPNIIEVDSGQTSNVANPVSIADGRGYFVALPNYYHKVRYAFNTFSGDPTDQIRIILPPSGEINKGKWLAIEDTHGLGVLIIGSPTYVPFPFIGGNTNRTRTYFHCNGENWIQINLMPTASIDLSSVTDNLFKLIPAVVTASGTGVGWDTANAFAIWEAVPNKLNKCSYGFGGNTPIKVVFPVIAGNEGKWLGIQKLSGTNVILPTEGLSGNNAPVLTNADGFKPTVYYHCTNEGWQMVSALRASVQPDLSVYELLANKELVALDNSAVKFPNNNVVKTSLDALSSSLLANCNDIRSTYLSKANNLSDLSNLALSRQNLGVEGLDKKGVANGYPSLDANGTIPSAQLPSYVDDVIEYATISAFPIVGVAGKIYVVTSGVDANKSYRWSGSTYIELISSPGSTDAIAEGTVNKYWTSARTLASSLAGFVAVAYSAITSADTVLSAFQKIQGFFNSLSTVAFSGNYNDLINKPTIPSGSALDKYYSTINRCSVTGSTTSLGTAWIIPFTPLADMSITQIGCLLTNANATERVDMAIYNSALTTNLGTAFSTFNSTGEKFVTLSTAVNLVGGTQVYLVLKGDNFGANNYAYSSCFSNALIARQINLGAGAITGSLAGAGASTVVPFISIK